MDKRLLIIVLFAFSVVNAQINENAPWVKKSQELSKSSKATLEEISTAFEMYMSDKDINKKGSGHKPFKRWEYRWSQSLLKDGTIAPSNYLWEAWKQKKALEQKSITNKSNAEVSNWTSVGPYKDERKKGQGRINTFIVDPNNSSTFYVGAPAGGLWKSTDSGENWVPLTDDLPQIGVSGIAIDPNNSNIIYITTGDDDAGDTYSVGVLKSIDGGLTWNTTGLSFSMINSSMNEIVIDPTDSNIIWAASNLGLYKSLDAGTSWSIKQSGNIKDFKLKPGDSNTIYACSSSSFYKSTDGNTFIEITSGLPTSSSRLTIDVTSANSEYVYVLSANIDQTFQGVYKSIDSGDSFNKTIEVDDIFESNQAWYDLALGVSNIDENLLFVGVLNIQKSTDGGDNFIKINNWNQPYQKTFTHADIHFMRYFDINGVSTLFAGTDGGIYKSEDNGFNFIDITETLNISQFYKISVSPQNPQKIAGGLQDNGGFGYSNNTWKNYHGGDGMDNVIDPNNQNLYYGFIQYGGALFKSTDGGEIGVYVASAPSDEIDAIAGDSGGNWVTPLAINSNSEIYAGYKKLYKLNVNIWEPISGSVFGGDIDNIEIDPSDNNIIYVSKSGSLYKSIDKGVTFSLLKIFTNVTSIEVNNNNNQILYITEGGYDGKIYKSNDGGSSFTDISGVLPTEPKLIVKHQSYSPNNDIYLGTELGVYHINDTMTDWELFSTGLPNVRITDLEINQDDETITASTYGRGVWQSPINVDLLSDDIRLISVESSMCGDIIPIITVENRGVNLISSIDVAYTIDTNLKNYPWTGSLASKETTQIALPTENLAIGSYDMTVEATISGDVRLDNNQSTLLLYANQNDSTPNVVNDFEDKVADKWLAYNEGEESVLFGIGTPSHMELNKSASGAFAYTNLPIKSNYPDETKAYLVSPCYNLASLINPVLKFNMAYKTEMNWDILYMQYSIDEGNSWKVLGTANDPNWYNSDRTNESSGLDDDCQNCPGAQWTGSSPIFTEYSYDLAALANEQNVVFRFVFVSDAAENDEGVVIDDFVIDGVLGLDDNQLTSVAIFPNPSSDIFNIQWRDGEDVSISLFDITGKLILKRDNINGAKRNYQLDLSNHAQGIYFMKLLIDNKQLTKKIILK